MTGQPEHVLIVGAGLGGLRTAEHLRSAGYQGRISLVGDEPHAPYDRPPLSKQVLTGEWEPDRIVLSTLDALDDLGVRTHLGLRAVGIAPGEIALSDGASLHADAIVIATGMEARTLPGQPPHVHTLRTLDDSLALRERLRRSRSLLIVGGGFIGAEVASAAVALGIPDITVLEAMQVPAARALGTELGTLAARLLSESGPKLRTGVTITRFLDAGEHVAIELADATTVEADAGVVGIGGTPRLDWLDSTGLDVTRGLLCGPSGRVHGLDSVWALGDVALWDDPQAGGSHRCEHWTNAGDQAVVVARDILDAAPPQTTVPYFWSDQFGLKIQLIGRAELGEGEILPLHGEGLKGGQIRGTVAAYFANERLVAVGGFGAARLIARYRPLVADGADRATVLATAAKLGG